MLFTEILLALQRGIFRLPDLQAFHHIGGAEGFQRASGKPFGRLRRGETLCETGKSKEGLSPVPSTRILVFVTNPIRSKRRAPKVSKGRSESPLVASAEAKSPEKRKKK